MSNERRIDAGRGVPADMQSRPAKPDDAPFPNPISTIERILDGPLDDDLIDTIPGLDMKEFDELCIQVGREMYRASGAVGARARLDPYPGADTFEGLATDEMHYHDGLLSAGLEGSVSAARSLKQVALYCERTIIRDTLFMPVVAEDPRTVFASRLRELLPIAGLIRSGSFVPVGGVALQSQEGVLYATKMRSDPLFAQLLAEDSPLVREVMHGLEYAQDASFRPSDYGHNVWAPPEPDMGRFVRDAARQLLRMYPESGITSDKLLEALLHCGQIRGGSFTPITSDPYVGRHLLMCAAAHPFMDDEALRTMRQAPSPFTPALVYDVPALNHISFDELRRLRATEEVFGVLDDALGRLSIACAQDATLFDDYESYRRAVRIHAREIIRPAREQLLRWYNGSEALQRRGNAAGELAGLGLDFVSIPGLSRVVGALVKRIVTGRKKVQRGDAAEIGARILKTLV